jgi:hypothetical protein
LNETDDIKTQKCSVIVIPSYPSESSFHLQENIITFKLIFRKTGDRQTGDRKTANKKIGNKTGDKKTLNKTDDIKTQNVPS